MSPIRCRTSIVETFSVIVYLQQQLQLQQMRYASLGAPRPAATASSSRFKAGVTGKRNDPLRAANKKGLQPTMTVDRRPFCLIKSWSGREDLNLRPLGPEPRSHRKSFAADRGF